MNTEVVTVASRNPTEPYYHFGTFIESLARFGVQPTVLGMNEIWRGLMEKPWRLREWLRSGSNKTEQIIVCDAFDIIFAEHPDEIGEKCRSLWTGTTIFNAEKGCWPREDLQPRFDQVYQEECGVGDDGLSPWRYLNSGFLCGNAKDILAILEAMGIESIGFDPPGGPYPNDQGEYQALFCREGDDFLDMAVDFNCDVSQTLSACELSEFDLSGPKIRNVITDTYPAIHHFNGGSKDNGVMGAFMEKLGL